MQSGRRIAAAGVLTADQQSQLHAAIDQWRAQNPAVSDTFFARPEELASAIRASGSAERLSRAAESLSQTAARLSKDIAEERKAILEALEPFVGLIQIPSEPVVKVLNQLGK
jgi:hypothetical protein